MDNIAGINGPRHMAQQQRLAGNKDSQFKETLSEVTAQKESQKAEQPALNALGEVRAPIPPIYNGVTTDIAQKSEALLDLIDSYADDLNNSAKTLKEIEPVIRSIREQADQLLKDFMLDPETQPEIKDIIERSAVMANVEYLKLYRGDYS